MKFVFVTFCIFLDVTFGLIGYDCGSRNLNITTISLRDVGECDTPENPVNVTQSYIQLLQINEYNELYVRQCKIEIKRHIYYCGMFSHIGLTTAGYDEYLKDIEKRTCDDAFLHGSMNLSSSHTMYNLKANSTKSLGFYLVGSVTKKDECFGGSYNDGRGFLSNVVVHLFAKVTLTDYTARVKLGSNTVHLRSGTVCSLSEGNCIDSEGGYTFWNPLPVDRCNFNKFSILYEGYANKLIDLESIRPQTVYTLTSHEVTFGLTIKDRETIWGYQIARTEHPKLVIFETTKGESFAGFNQVSVSNLDLFTYINSKFVYIERHIRTQMQSLYRDIINQNCNLERQILRTALTVGIQNPDQFAYDFMKNPGYMALVAGDVVHIIKCVPVEVRIEHGNACYNELQVTHSNKTYFMAPRTNILKSKGTEITCNKLLPAIFKVGSSWYKILPTPTEVHSPIEVKPGQKKSWQYVVPAHLATSGIYTEDDINKMRETIMFPVERPAMLNDLARGLEGYATSNSGGGFLNLFNEEVIEKFVHNTWERIWNKMMIFGTISAGFFGILTIFNLIKILVDVIVHGYTLHRVYGWSIHLLGAVFSSIAHLLVHLAPERPNPEEPREPENQAVVLHTPTRLEPLQPSKTVTINEAVTIPTPEVISQQQQSTAPPLQPAEGTINLNRNLYPMV